MLHRRHGCKVSGMTEFEIGDVITNGSSAGRVVERVADKDPRWKALGVRIENIPLKTFGGNVGMTSFVPDYLLNSWHRVPFDWTPVTGTGLEERYVWTGCPSSLVQELRRTREG